MRCERAGFGAVILARNNFIAQRGSVGSPSDKMLPECRFQPAVSQIVALYGAREAPQGTLFVPSASALGWNWD